MVPRLSIDSLRAEVTFTRTTVGTARLALHGFLLIATLFTTSIVGVVLAEGFRSGRPVTLEQYIDVFSKIFAHPALLLDGLPFSLTLITILLAHEMGHYLACRYYGIDATLPFFLPFPTLIGTLGAFIRIRSPIYTRRALFDVGIAGPIAGFVLLLPALIIGLAQSKIIPGIANQGDVVFGVPAIQRAVEWLIFPGTPSADIYLHPVARAAWVGILATALNLLPIGQLDGGHILYSFVGHRHKLLSRLFIICLVPLGIFYWRGWLLWVALLIFGLRHPVICDVSGLGANRAKLGLAALVIFLLTFTLVPIH